MDIQHNEMKNGSTLGKVFKVFDPYCKITFLLGYSHREFHIYCNYDPYVILVFDPYLLYNRAIKIGMDVCQMGFTLGIDIPFFMDQP